ncbi:hypothetical protein EDD17DRAFT_1507851 [Pisolithus thermaeus]|nr:hypothetical protein EDD17DRAFT_1507851 [Pisolithus thermaeus]
MLKKATRFETAPGDGKKAFTESSEASKDWVLNGENILMHYLLTVPEVEISLDEDGNAQMPTWAGQKLKVQQNLARAVFQAAYVWDIAKFTKKPKAKVPWGLLIKSPMEYLDSQFIPEGFMMKDPSKWTKADLGMLWGHWETLEAEEKVIVSFIHCKKEDAPLSWQFDRRPVGWSSKKREWMDPEDAVFRCRALQEDDKHWYQVLVDLVEGLPEEECGKGREAALPHCATWTWGAKYLPQEIHSDEGSFWKALGHAQEVEEDDPLVSHLQFLLNSELGIRRAEDVMDIVGLIVSRLEQSSAGMKEPKEGGEVAVMGEGDREDEEKEEEEAPAMVPTQKRKRAESRIVTRGKKVAKKDGEKGKKDGERGKKDGENGMKGPDETAKTVGGPAARSANPTSRTVGGPAARTVGDPMARLADPTSWTVGGPAARSANPTSRTVGDPMARESCSKGVLQQGQPTPLPGLWGILWLGQPTLLPRLWGVLQQGQLTPLPGHGRSYGQVSQPHFQGGGASPGYISLPYFQGCRASYTRVGPPHFQDHDWLTPSQGPSANIS